MHEENRLRFPFFVTVKIWRRPAKTSAEQPGLGASSATQTNDFDCFIVDADAQAMHESPSLHSMMMLPMLSHSADNVLPAALAIVKTSQHYPMAVEYITQPVPAELAKSASKVLAGTSMLRPCNRVVALVLSSKRSVLTKAGENGYKLVTHDVVDLLPSFNDDDKKYTLVSFCPLETVTDFKLDPPARSKTQAALVTVTAVIDKGKDSAGQPVQEFLVDNVQLLGTTEADTVALMLSKSLYLASLSGQISPKRDIEWSADESPAKAKTCRVLGRSPTGPPLPDYSAS